MQASKNCHVASRSDARTDLVPLRNTLASVVHALDNLPEWTGVFASSAFDQRIVFRRPPPVMRDRESDSSRPELPEPEPESTLANLPIRDRDIDRIRHWFEASAGVVLSKQTVTDAVRIVGDRHAFHPVREYLEALSWDGTPRVDRWLEEYASVRPTSEGHEALVRSVARKWLVSCVARAMRPGCKVDTMLILEGRQGIGKSRALAALAGDTFFCDAAIDLGSKDACQTIQGVWIFELAELDAILRRDPSVVKAFLSRSVDRFRVPYGRAPENVPRSVVFAGTVNHGGYLRDTTGNRRYWVVRSEAPLDVDGLRAARDAIWAEATQLYRRGETWHLGPEHDALMQGEHETRLEVDPWEEAIAAWTALRSRPEGEPPFTMDDVLGHALGLRTSNRNSIVTNRVARLLGTMGYERKRRAALPRTYHYVRAPVSPAHRPTGSE